MTRHYGVLLVICALLLFIVLWSLFADNTKTKASIETDKPVTNVHKYIVQEKEWLNTSRALEAEDLAGRIILLDFWTFCCINCIHVIPDLQYLEEKFGKDLTVVGVHSAKFANERDKENIRSAILRYGIEHPVVNDHRFRIWQSFGARAWPTFVLVNPAGRIEEVYSGEGHRDELERDIERLIRQYRAELNSDLLPLALEKHKTPETVLKFPGKLRYAEEIQGAPALLIADSGHDRILGVRLDGTIFLEIGTGEGGLKDGSFDQAQFDDPQGLLYRDGIIYVADRNNHVLRKIDLKRERVSTIAGTGTQGYDRRVKNEPATKTNLASPWDLAFYPDQNHITIAMAGTHQLWTYHITEQTVSVLAGNGRESIDDGPYPRNSLSQPSGLAVLGNKLYFVDSETSSLRVLEEGYITTLIGTGLFDFGFQDGLQGDALMQHPLGVCADNSSIYITDSYNHSIRKYDPQSGRLTTVFGDGDRGKFNEPNDIIEVGDVFYIADTNNNRIATLDPESGSVETIEVMPAEIGVAEPIENLPNVQPGSAPEVMADKEITVNLLLPPNWKINDRAPSWLALFEKTESGTKLLQHYDEQQIKEGNLSFSALADDKSYRLQGTFYYCEDKVGALCLIQSYDSSFTPMKNHGISELPIVLQEQYNSM